MLARAACALLVPAVLLVAAPAPAQNLTAVKGDAVLVGGKPALKFELKQVDRWTSWYLVKGPDGKPVAEMTFLQAGAQVQFRCSFPALDRFFECAYPAGTTFETVMESFHKNQVIVDGKASLPGATQYCATRGMALRGESASIARMQAMKAPPPPPSAPAAAPSRGGDDAPAAAGSTDVSFTLKNNGSKTVRIFIGSKPKYGSGRTSGLGGNTLVREHGRVGDQLCIVDGSDNPLGCTTLGAGLDRVDVNASGTGFGP